MTRAKTLLLAAGALLAGACNPTAVVVGVATDLPYPDRLDTITADVTDDAGQSVLHHQWALGPSYQQFDLPGSFTLSPASGDATSHYTVVLSGSRVIGTASDGSPQVDVFVKRRVRLGFVAGKTLFYRMAIVDACVHRDTCPLGSSCVSGECLPDDHGDGDHLPDYTPRLEYRSMCNTDYQSLGIDMPPSPSCQPGASCIDDTCIGIPPLDFAGVTGPPLSSDGGGPMGDGPLMRDGGGPLDDGGIDAAGGDAGGSLDAAGASGDGPIDLAGAMSSDFTGMSIDLTLSSGNADLTMAAGTDLSGVAPADMTVSTSTRDMSSSGAPADLAGQAPGLGPLQWIAPLPQGDDITAISVDPANTTGSPFWAVTTGGAALKYVNGTLSLESTPATYPLWAVYVHGGDVWAAGAAPEVLHRDANGTWTRLKPDRSYAFTQVYGITGDGGNGALVAVQTGYILGNIHPPVAEPLLRASATALVASDVASVKLPPPNGDPPNGTPESVGARTVWTRTANGQQCGAIVDTNAITWVTTSLAAPTVWTPIIRDPNDPGTSALTVFGCEGGAATKFIYNHVTGITQTSTYTITNDGWLTTGKIAGVGPVTQIASATGSSTDVWAASSIYPPPPPPLPGASPPDPPLGQLVHFDGTNTTTPNKSAPWVANPQAVTAVGAGFDGTEGKQMIIVAAGSGIWSSADGTTWKSLAPAQPTLAWNGKGWGVDTDQAKPDTMLVVPSGANAYVTTDLNTWSQVTGGTPGNRGIGQIFAINYDNGSGPMRKWLAALTGAMVVSSDDILNSGFSNVELPASRVSVATDFYGLWATDAGNIFVVGQQATTDGMNAKVGVVWANLGEGSAWASLKVIPLSNAMSTSTTLTAVWGFGVKDVYLGGTETFANGARAAVIWHYDGANTTSVFSDVSDDGVTAIWGTTSGGIDDVWAVGPGSIMFHFAGAPGSLSSTSFTSLPAPTGTPLRAVLGTGKSDVYAAGDEGVVVHFDGTSWTQIPTGTTAASFNGLWVDTKRIWFGGPSGVMSGTISP